MYEDQRGCSYMLINKKLCHFIYGEPEGDVAERKCGLGK
jgi:hypothetical protein